MRKFLRHRTKVKAKSSGFANKLLSYGLHWVLNSFCLSKSLKLRDVSLISKTKCRLIISWMLSNFLMLFFTTKMGTNYLWYFTLNKILECMFF